MPSQYAFKYLGADRQEVEMEAFPSKNEAETARKTMTDMGAICTPAYPVSKAFTNQEPEGYLERKVFLFQQYLDMELAIIDHDGVTYQIVYDYLKELPERVSRFVRQGINSFFPDDEIPEDMLTAGHTRGAYVGKVASVLESRSRSFSPMDGSVPEDIGRCMKQLAQKVARFH